MLRLDEELGIKFRVRAIVVWIDKATWLASPRPVLGAVSVASAIEPQCCAMSFGKGTTDWIQFSSFGAVFDCLSAWNTFRTTPADRREQTG